MKLSAEKVFTEKEVKCHTFIPLLSTQQLVHFSGAIAQLPYPLADWNLIDLAQSLMNRVQNLANEA